jgi:serine/threonine protein kinase
LFLFQIPNDSRISPECRNLLEGLLQRDPNKRISFPDFFQHPFIFNNLSSQISRAVRKSSSLFFLFLKISFILQDEFLQKAIHYEQSGDLKKALDYRVRALDEYTAIIKGIVSTNQMEMRFLLL